MSTTTTTSNSTASSTTIRTPRAESKVARATRIFCEMKHFARAFVVKRFEEDLDMTPKAASTYYQNCRKQAGLVNPRNKMRSQEATVAH